MAKGFLPKHVREQEEVQNVKVVSNKNGGTLRLTEDDYNNGFNHVG